MGKPKLTLPWQQPGEPTTTIIGKVLSVWKAAQVPVVAICRADDVVLQAQLEAGDATVIAPAAPPAEMLESVQLALREIIASGAPSGSPWQDDDLWLLSPADMPFLSAALIRHLVAAAEQFPCRVLRPTLGIMRGHPIAVPFLLSPYVLELTPQQTLRDVLDFAPTTFVACDEALVAGNEQHLAALAHDGKPLAFRDVDTAAEYERWQPSQ